MVSCGLPLLVDTHDNRIAPVSTDPRMYYHLPQSSTQSFCLLVLAISCRYASSYRCKGQKLIYITRHRLFCRMTYELSRPKLMSITAAETRSAGCMKYADVSFVMKAVALMSSRRYTYRGTTSAEEVQEAD